MRVAKKGRKQSLESKEATKQKGAKVATKDDDDCDDDTEGEESAPGKDETGITFCFKNVK